MRQEHVQLLVDRLKWELVWGARESFLEQVSHVLGRVPSMLASKPEVPHHMMWVLQAFGELNYRRQGNPGSLVPLTLADMYAMSRVLGRSPRKTVPIFMALDRAYLAAFPTHDQNCETLLPAQAGGGSRRDDPPPLSQLMDKESRHEPLQAVRH